MGLHGQQVSFLRRQRDEARLSLERDGNLLSLFRFAEPDKKYAAESLDAEEIFCLGRFWPIERGNPLIEP